MCAEHCISGNILYTTLNEIIIIMRFYSHPSSNVSNLLDCMCGMHNAHTILQWELISIVVLFSINLIFIHLFHYLYEVILSTNITLNNKN